MIVGKYVVGDVFSGTDKLSMAVQLDFEDFLEKYNKHNILFEGDRLFNIKTLKKAKELINTKVYIIESKHTDDRHIQRNDNQSECMKNNIFYIILQFLYAKTDFYA